MIIEKGAVYMFAGPRGGGVKPGELVRVLSDTVTPATMLIRVENVRTRKACMVNVHTLTAPPDSSHADRV